ncbi:hypothetical protein F4802DRAFT_543247 [Xylaria palmicola]|nr:hypothetical protein F4802DRAFT_543247 [Xylaria palmicola]
MISYMYVYDYTRKFFASVFFLFFWMIHQPYPFLHNWALIFLLALLFIFLILGLRLVLRPLGGGQEWRGLVVSSSTIL